MQIASIGEAMVELRQEKDLRWSQSFGGDAFNFAVYLRRALAEDSSVEWISGIASDSMWSTAMQMMWRREGLCDTFCADVTGHEPGIYAISTDALGERRFTYWRSASAARYALNEIDYRRLGHHLTTFEAVFFTGVTLAIQSDQARRSMLAMLATLRAQGVSIVFDPNYRPVLWASADDARFWVEEAYRVTSTVLPTLSDLESLCGHTTAEQCMDHASRIGVPEIVVKLGADGVAVFADNGAIEHVPVRRVKPVDTTGAGDAFNGTYVGHRLTGANALRAAIFANQVASAVTLMSGAIVSREHVAAALQ